MPDLALSIVLGIALAAATGFRVFLPMLIMSGAAYTEHCVSDSGRLSAYFFGSVSHRGCLF
jgi:hypothetical protein